MRTLFAISILAMVALLWASVAIAQHILRARLRRRRTLRSRQAIPVVQQQVAQQQVAQQQVAQEQAIQQQASPKPAFASPEPAAPNLLAFKIPERFMPTPATSARQPSAAQETSQQSSAAWPVPPPPKPVRSVSSDTQESPFAPGRRPDWAYFNKDMGDLSDPSPSRVRVRSR